MTEGNFSVPPADKEKLIAERQEAQTKAFAEAAAAAPASSPGTVDLSGVAENLTPDQLREAGQNWPGLTPQETEFLLDGLFSSVLEWGGKEGLTPHEVQRGGKMLTPALNKWAPYVLTQHSELVVATIWVAGVVRARKKTKPKPSTLDEARRLVAELEAKQRADAEYLAAHGENAA